MIPGVPSICSNPRTYFLSSYCTYLPNKQHSVVVCCMYHGGTGTITFRLSARVESRRVMASENHQVCPRIHLGESYTNAEECPSLEKINQFSMDGYSVFPNVLSQQCVDALNHRLELVLRGEYDTQMKPDKSPKLIKTPMSNDNLNSSKAGNDNDGDGFKRTEDEDLRRRINSKKALGYSGNTRKKVFQVINIHKSDRLFHELVTNPFLGKLVAKLMNWEEGARLAQDQIWAK